MVGDLREEGFSADLDSNCLRISSRYGCKVTAPIFGDFAQATLLGGAESRQYPMELALVYAAAERQPANAVSFSREASVHRPSRRKRLVSSILDSVMANAPYPL